VDRWPGLLRAAVGRSAHDRGAGGLAIDVFYDRLRAFLLDADAVDADLGALAYALVCLIVDRTGRGSGEREGQLELMARYVAGADMTVRLSPGDMNVRVQFPDRPVRLC
jgi:hypothetical protein